MYVLIMSRSCFRVNPHSIVAWMWKNSLLVFVYELSGCRFEFCCVFFVVEPGGLAANFSMAFIYTDEFLYFLFLYIVYFYVYYLLRQYQFHNGWFFTFSSVRHDIKWVLISHSQCFLLAKTGYLYFWRWNFLRFSFFIRKL